MDAVRRLIIKAAYRQVMAAIESDGDSDAMLDKADVKEIVTECFKSKHRKVFEVMESGGTEGTAAQDA